MYKFYYQQFLFEKLNLTSSYKKLGIMILNVLKILNKGIKKFKAYKNVKIIK